MNGDRKNVRGKVSRRDFFGKVSRAAAGIGLGVAGHSGSQGEGSGDGRSPNEKIVLGLIGCGGRGIGIMKGRSFEEGFFGQPLVAGFAAVCDVNSRHAELAAATAEKEYGKRPKALKDFRHLLAWIIHKHPQGAV